VSDAAATKAPIAKIADKVSGVFVPVVIAVAFIATVAWLIADASFGYALARGISVLVISCPCALGLATPVAIMVGNGVGAKKGILFKSAAALEEAGRIKIVALDKTGTVTRGEPRVTDVITVEGIYEYELLRVARCIEEKSEHPLARAIVEFCKNRRIDSDVEVEGFRVLVGSGVEGEMNGKKVLAGNLKLVDEFSGVSDEMREKADALSGEGKTPVFFSLDGVVIGALALADTLKNDSKAAVKELSSMGVRVVMLTGDNERCASAIGREAGIDEVYAGVLPDGKERIIRELKAQGKVMMVGDGINDAPALTSANVGVAIGAGTDVAIDAADVVLMNSNLTDVVSAIKLSRATLKNIRQNLFWAFFYNSVGIPLAAGAFIAWLGWEMNPMFGAAAMSLSSFCVVTNALRLNFIKLPIPRVDKEGEEMEINVNTEIVKGINERSNIMQKTLNIEGMMCPHCEARVKKCLEAVDGVVSADVSHKTDSATLTLAFDVSDELLKKTVEDAGYTVK
jgi:Cu2+-exporting ATPase